MTMQWIRKNYGVPAKRGKEVTWRKQRGVITSAEGNVLRVRFENDTRTFRIHPTDSLIYHRTIVLTYCDYCERRTTTKQKSICGACGKEKTLSYYHCPRCKTPHSCENPVRYGASWWGHGMDCPNHKEWEEFYVCGSCGCYHMEINSNC